MMHQAKFDDGKSCISAMDVDADFSMTGDEDTMSQAHSARDNYKKQLHDRRLRTDKAVSAAGQELKGLLHWYARVSRERGHRLRAGHQLRCMNEVLLQALTHKEATIGEGVAPNHEQSMRGRKRRLGDLLPFNVLVVHDGPALLKSLKKTLCVKEKLFNNKLQELGLCPPGDPAHWGRGENSLWNRAWRGEGQLVLLRSEQDAISDVADSRRARGGPGSRP